MVTSSSGKYVLANGTRVYLEDAGSGRPLLLIHGGVGTAQDNFAQHIPLFAKHFRVIAPDSRGHGRTENPHDRLTYGTMADDVAALIRAMDLPRPYVCGWSDGGQIALELAMRYPDIASAYIAGGVCRSLSQKATSALNAIGFLAPGTVDLQKMEESVPALTAKARQLHSPQGNEYWKDLLVAISFLWLTPFEYTESDFTKITAPTLFLLGDRDQFNPLEQIVEMYRFTPSSELAIVPNSDHSLRSDVVRFTEIVLEFLLRQPSGSSQ